MMKMKIDELLLCTDVCADIVSAELLLRVFRVKPAESGSVFSEQY